MGLDLTPDSESLQNFTLLLSAVHETDFTSASHVQQLEKTAAVLMGWSSLPASQRGIVGTTQVGKAACAFMAAIKLDTAPPSESPSADCITLLRQAFKESGLLTIVSEKSGIVPAWANDLREKTFGEWQAQRTETPPPKAVLPAGKKTITAPECDESLLIDRDDVREIYQAAKQKLSPYSLYVLTAKTLYKPEHQLSYARIAETLRQMNSRIAAEPFSNTVKRLSVIAAIAKRDICKVLEERGIETEALNYARRPVAAPALTPAG